MTMTAGVDGLRRLVSGYLNERWQGVYQNSGGAFIIPGMGNTVCLVEVTETQQGRPCLDIHAPMVVGIPSSAPLFEIVALSANKYDFGALSLFTDGEQILEFKYVLVADSISSGLLNYVVQHVAAAASEAAPDYRDAFGGRLISE